MRTYSVGDLLSTALVGTLFIAGAFAAPAAEAIDLPPGKCSALESSTDDFRVASESTTFDKRFPDIARAGNGTSMVVWESFGTNAGTDHDRGSIHGRLFAADGTALAAQFQINTVTVDEQRFPSVGAGPNGGPFVIAWRSGTPFGEKQVRARIVNVDGTPLGPDFQVNNVSVNAGSLSGDTVPQVVVGANGTILFTWHSYNSPGADDTLSVQARLFATNGTPLGQQFEVNQTTTSTQNNPQASATPDGGFLIAWMSARSAGTDNSSRSVQARRLNSQGAFAGPEFQVNTYISGAQEYPSVATGPNGQSLVVWQSSGSDGSDNDRTSVQAQALGANSELIGPQFQVNQTIGGDQGRADVAAGPNGDFLVSWQSATSPASDQSGTSVIARHVASPGRFFDVEFQVNTNENQAQQFPAVVMGPDNAIVVFFSVGLGAGLAWESLAQVLDGVVSANSMCLQDRRFLVQVDWNSGSEQGEGTVVSGGSDDSGMFWFFQEENWEMLVKVLNGCGINQRFWVFAAATTDVAYNLRVTDLFSGEQVIYHNALGNASDAITDSGAFDTCDVGNSSEVGAAEYRLTERPLVNQPVEGWLPGWTGVAGSTVEAENPDVATDLVSETLALCSPGSESLCLENSRFEVTVDFRTPQGTGRAKRVNFGSPGSGLFWFFQSNNWEMLVKVLNGCGINQRYWVFAAATTDVEYTLRVRDTETNEVVEYFNPLGQASAAITDSGAFATCSP